MNSTNNIHSINCYCRTCMPRIYNYEKQFDQHVKDWYDEMYRRADAKYYAQIMEN